MKMETVSSAPTTLMTAAERGLKPSSSTKTKAPKVFLLPLVFLIFYEVSGGPFGIEYSVQAGGPLLAIIGFVVFPLIWSVPEALITAELGTMFPEDGGYAVWISEACGPFLGPFWGFQQGWCKWLSGVINNAISLLLILDYLKVLIPAVSSGPMRIVAIIVLTVLLTYLNYRGLTIVGCLAVILGVFSLLPILIMSLCALPRLKPARWLEFDFARIDWTMYLNTLFWNVSNWDSISTLAGEVDSPHRTLPKALLYAVILVVGGHLIPLLAGTGAVDVARSNWTNGYFAHMAITLGGVWLGWWMSIAAALSNVGLFESAMSSDSFLLLGMAERGMLPRCFAKRSQHGTPIVGILVSATAVLLFSSLGLQEIIAVSNSLYCFGMLAEFAAFLWLRLRRPNILRPHKLPLGIIGSTIMCIPPTIMMVLVMVLGAGVGMMLVAITVAQFGMALCPCLALMQKDRPQFQDDANIVNANGFEIKIGQQSVDVQVESLNG